MPSTLVLMALVRPLVFVARLRIEGIHVGHAAAHVEVDELLGGHRSSVGKSRDWVRGLRCECDAYSEKAPTPRKRLGRRFHETAAGNIRLLCGGRGRSWLVGTVLEVVFGFRVAARLREWTFAVDGAGNQLLDEEKLLGVEEGPDDVPRRHRRRNARSSAWASLSHLGRGRLAAEHGLERSFHVFSSGSPAS